MNYYLFLSCRGHKIRIGGFTDMELALREAAYHSINCGDSVLFELWHERKLLASFVNGDMFEGGSK